MMQLKITGTQPGDIFIRDAKIIAANDSSSNTLHFENAIAFPGLINSHDHLDFNLFPKLGKGKYRNYIEWGERIHADHAADIARIQKVPVDLKVKWGVYKNLLNGFTTVVDHGKDHDAGDEIITVLEGLNNFHSLANEKFWKLKLLFKGRRNDPIILHLGEGVDNVTAAEAGRLMKWNLLNRKIIAVHGVRLSSANAANLDGLVWCPDSNYFLLGETADVKSLKDKVNIVFGTDSTLTSSWNVWEQLRLAKGTGMADEEEIFNMMTTNPAKLWQLNSGALNPGYDADIVIARKTRPGLLDSFFEINPAELLLVISKGRIRLYDKTLAAQLHALDDFNPRSFAEVNVCGTSKFVYGDINALADNIKSYTGLDPRNEWLA
jgi:cytosine/adenosine deaminase-related metal-dependent hydrolase